MIDTGSSAGILFYDAFKRMRFTKTLLKQERTPLIGFVDITRIVDFIVIYRPLSFNAILGIPWLYNMKAVPSTYHQCLKFSTPRRTENVQGSQKSSRTCYLASFKDLESPLG
ncbi:hypothetical protein N665_0218s0073 [Sinapis alba]|nr:hypothetical protein N665_0218s0073 [Sinapis alba]